jgi:hypothetical protein
MATDTVTTAADHRGLSESQRSFLRDMEEIRTPLIGLEPGERRRAASEIARDLGRCISNDASRHRMTFSMVRYLCSDE